MNENGHDGWSEDLAAHVLGALEPERAAELERHAEGCERCREQIRWLRPAVAAIAEAAPRREPPPELRRRLLEEVEADARAAGAEVEAGSGFGAAWRRLGEWLGGAGPGGRWRPLAAGLAVLVLFAAGVAGYEVGSGGGGGGASFTGVEHGVTAEVVRQGGAPSSASPTSASCRPTGCSRPGCSAKAPSNRSRGCSSPTATATPRR